MCTYNNSYVINPNGVVSINLSRQLQSETDMPVVEEPGFYGVRD
jgi:hypothetical protein